MALYQRRESPGRTRFLLALSLSTVTALAVAAPLAIEAVNADEVNFASATPDVAEVADTADAELLSGDAPDRSLSEHDGGSKGGIGVRAAGKAQAQTSKSDATESSPPVVEPQTADSVLTNPTTTATAAPTTTTAAPTTTTAAPTTTKPSTTTTTPSSTTTTNPSVTTTSRPSTSTTQASTTTTAVTTSVDPQP